MKELKNIEEDFLEGIKIYDDDIRDYFGNKCYVWVNEDLEEIRIIAKNPDYKVLRKNYPQYVGISKWLEVIDFTEKMYQKIVNDFPDYVKKPREMLNIL